MRCVATLLAASLVAFDVRHDQGAGSVAAAQRLRLAGAPVGHDGIDTGRVGELLGDRLTGGDGVGLVDGSAAGVGRKDDEVGLAGVKSLRQQVGGTDRFGRGTQEATAGQPVGDVTAVRCCCDQQHERRYHNRLGA